MKTTLLKLAATLAAFAPCIRAAEDVPVNADGAQRFDVLEYRVLGNTVLAAEDIERALYPQLGTGKQLADVEATRALLENAYRAAGYPTVFVDIPEQDTADGVIRLKVTEGRLERTRVAGARYFSGRQIKAALPDAAVGTVPHLPSLQQELAAVNAQSPDRTVTPVLAQGRDPGTMGLSLNVDDKLPLHGHLEVNDQYTSNTTRYRAIAAVSYDNLFNRLDSLSAQIQTAPEDTHEARVWAASYTTRLGAANRLSAFYVNSDSNVAAVGDAGSSIDVLGKGAIYGLRFIRTLSADAAATHVLIFGLEYKDFNESVFAQDVLQTPVSYINASLGHVSAWRGDERQWSLASTVNFGLRGRYNDPLEFAEKRFRGRPNYFYLRADGSLLQRLPLGMSLRFRAGGQYAVESLISNEQLSIAGADGVRGYLEAEVLGDVAIKASAELALPRLALGPGNAQAFAFVDGGRIERLNPLRAQDPRTGALLEFLEPPRVTIASVGAGVDLSLWDFLNANLVWAYALRDAPGTHATQAHDSRLHFTLRTTW